MFSLEFKTLLIAILAFGSSMAFANQNNNSYDKDISLVLIAIRNHDFEIAIKNINALDDRETIKLLQNYLFLIKKKGEQLKLKNVSLPSLIAKNNNNLLALYHLNKGLYSLLYNYDKDNQAMGSLDKALDYAKKSRNKIINCEVLKAMLVYYDRLLLIKEEMPDYYFKIYKDNIFDKREELIYEILEINANISLTKKIMSKEVSQLIKKLKSCSSPYYKAFGYKVVAQYLDLIEEKKDSAFRYHLKAAKEIKNENYGAAFLLKNIIAINIGSLHYEKMDYKKALTILREIKTDTITKTNLIYAGYKTVWLAKTFEKLKIYDSANFYHKRKLDFLNRLNQEQHAGVIAENRIKTESVSKDQKIDKLLGDNNKLKKNIMTITPILGVITIILILIFYLYKRYKNKAGILEKDQSETLQKLDELKNIVVKNHIILKDKSKVYISDLMYIKADDHYLNIFISEGKNHFVRGKLSQIKEELPPNFIRCHRSYIVNRNFVKQINRDSLTLLDKTRIPLSRTYKDKFK